MTPFIIISVAAFLAVSAFVALIWIWIGDLRPTATEARLQELSRSNSPVWELRSILKSGTDQVEPWQLWLRLRNGVLTLIEQSRAPFDERWFLGLSIGCAILGLAAAVFGHAPWPLIAPAAFFGGLLPTVWLAMRRRARHRRFNRQLPEALDLLARALRSGRSLNAGLLVVSQEMLPPISEEFRIVTEAVNLGVMPDRALDELARRIPNHNLRFLAASVAMQRQSGGNLSHILEKISRIVRDRFRILGQVQALTGEGRISGTVLMSLPIALFFALSYLNPSYVMILVHDEFGRQMLGGAIALQVVGALVIRKIVDIKI